MIQIENLSKTYATPHGQFQALRGINLHIQQGEVFGIIGPSGAGKSTLVQCINLLERPNEGSIAIGGQALTGLSEAQLRAQRRRIGMVFQGFNLLSRRTVYGNVALPLEIAGVAKSEIPARVERLLALVGLEHLRDRYPSQISGGQKQRVGIARALANNPDVLLSDEATSALDPETTHNILALLRDINRKTGVTVVMITHQMEVVREVCDRVAVLSQGEVVEMGSTREVFAQPRHEVTRAMVSAATASDLTDATLAAVKQRIETLAAAKPGQAVRLLRLSLTGTDASGSFLSDLSTQYSLDVGLVQARVEDIQGVAVGTMFVLAQGAPAAVKDAIAALTARDITVEEIAHESATDRPAYYVAACHPADGGRGQRHRSAGRHSAGLCDWSLCVSLAHVQPLDWFAAPRLAAGLAANWIAGVQRSRPGRYLDHLHLFDLADGHQHCRRGAARAAGLYERCPRAEPVGVEDCHHHPVPGCTALSADGRAPGRRHCLAGDRSGRNAHRWCRHWFLGLG